MSFRLQHVAVGSIGHREDPFGAQLYQVHAEWDARNLTHASYVR